MPAPRVSRAPQGLQGKTPKLLRQLEIYINGVLMPLGKKSVHSVYSVCKDDSWNELTDIGKLICDGCYVFL